MSALRSLAFFLLSSVIKGDPLCEAVHAGDVQKLEAVIHGGASVDQLCHGGGSTYTPLMAAAKAGDIEIVEALLEYNASVDKPGSTGRVSSSLMWAAFRGHKEIVELLLKYNASVEQSDGLGRCALIYAAAWGDEEIVDLLLKHNASLDHSDRQGRIALMIAACKGHEEIVEMLLTHNASVDKEDNFGFTALFGAAMKDDTKVAEWLLKYNASLDKKSDDGDSLLITAARHGSIGIVKMLVRRHANTLLRDRAYHTPQVVALMNHHKQVAKYLSEKSPRGLDLVMYELSRPQAWLSMAAGLLGAILVQCATSCFARRPPVETHMPVPASLLTAEVAEMSSEPQAPRGTLLLAAKKIHSGAGVTMWRLIQVWSDIVFPFGVYMLLCCPPFVLMSYAICYALPASRIHGTRAVLEKPVLMLSGMPPIAQVFRTLGIGAGVLLILAISGPDFWASESTFSNKAGGAVEAW